MAADDLATARAMFDAWNDGNVGRMVEFWADDGVWEDAPEIPDHRVVHGRENVEDHLREVIAILGDLELHPLEVRMAGDDVLAVLDTTFRGAQSGIVLDAPVAVVVRFEEGRVKRYRSFLDVEDAKRAVGEATD